MKKICVIGLGYIGLPTASLFANEGFRVIGVDSNPKVVEMINDGRNHIEEVGLKTLVEAASRSGMLSASLKPDKADVFIIAVPTPFGAHKEPDLTHVFDAANAIAPFLEGGNLVVVESTVPPGTTEKVAELIAAKRKDLVGDPNAPVASLKVSFAHCPERVLPGKILKELVENDRVVGGLNSEATEQAIEVYRSIVSGTIYATDASTAEMVKLAENTFRDVNISLANEFAVICQRLGINVWEMIELANKHPRVKILSPGPGVGGHCIAVDPWFIVSQFPDETHVIHAARFRNDSMPAKVVQMVAALIGDEVNPKIACMGASYKANVGDARNSPAIEIYNMLLSRFSGRAEVCINDMHVENSKLPLKGLDEVLEDASLILILTDHQEYKALDPLKVAKKMRQKRVFDTRNALDHKKWRAAGFSTFLLGDGSMGQNA